MYFRKKDISESLLKLYIELDGTNEFFIKYKNNRHFLKLNFQEHEKEIGNFDLYELSWSAYIDYFIDDLTEKLPMVNHLIPQDENLYDVLDKLFEDDIFEFVIPKGDKTVKDNVDKIYEILIKEFPILKEFSSQKIFIDKIRSFFNRFAQSALGFSIFWILGVFSLVLLYLIFIEGPALQIEKLTGLDSGLGVIVIIIVGALIFKKRSERNR